MTSKKISHVLSKFGHSADTWSALSGISIVFLAQDSSIYPDDRSRRIKFNTESEMIEIVYGYTHPKTGVFIAKNNGATSNFKPDTYYDFSMIHGFVSSSLRLQYGSFTQAPFIY